MRESEKEMQRGNPPKTQNTFSEEGNPQNTFSAYGAPGNKWDAVEAVALSRRKLRRFRVLGIRV